ncbi:MAG: hypothetical protein SGCHY_004174 [Lobulomycetales sp.]
MEDIFKEERKREEARSAKKVEELSKEISNLRSTQEKAFSEQQKHHLQELNKLHETLQSQKEAWQQQYISSQQSQYASDQKAWKEKMIQERDAEIELIITRLSSEGSADTSDLERRHRMEVERLKTESANTVRDLRQEHSLALDRVVEYQNRTADLEKDIKAMQKQISHLETSKLSKEHIIAQQRNALERLQGKNSKKSYPKRSVSAFSIPKRLKN